MAMEPESNIILNLKNSHQFWCDFFIRFSTETVLNCYHKDSPPHIMIVDSYD